MSASQILKGISYLVLTGLFVYVLLLAVGAVDLPSHGAQPRHKYHGQRPYEYLYLDSARVNAYLGQLNEGEVKTESRSESQTASAEGGLQIDTLGKATVSSGSERKSSAVVTLTEADNFYKLLHVLGSEGTLESVDMESPELEQLLGALPDGTMVRITNAFIEVPPYLSAYPALRYAHSIVKHGDPVFGEAPLNRYGAAEVALNTEAKRQREAFIRNAGENPRLPLILSSSSHVSVVVPARYANVTGDASLFGDRMTVMGKIVYRGLKFGDGVSVNTYLPALLRASNRFLGDIGVKAAFLRRYRRAGLLHHGAHALALRERLFRALASSLTFGRTFEVIPVAIYD
jgi:hypothetical protein